MEEGPKLKWSKFSQLILLSKTSSLITYFRHDILNMRHCRQACFSQLRLYGMEPGSTPTLLTFLTKWESKTWGDLQQIFLINLICRSSTTQWVFSCDLENFNLFTAVVMWGIVRSNPFSKGFLPAPKLASDNKNTWTDAWHV